MSAYWESLTDEELIERLRSYEKEFLFEPIAEALARILPNALHPIYIATRVEGPHE